jgi:hypothetical protein
MPFLAHRVGQRQRVHHGGQHAHVVGGRAVHADRAAGTPRKMLPPPITTATSQPELRHFLHLAHHAHDRRAVDAVGVVAHQASPESFSRMRL